MKKIIAAALTAVMCFSLSSCMFLPNVPFEDLFSFEEEETVFSFIEEESFFDGYEIDEEESTVRFRYSVCCENSGDYDIAFSVCAGFDEKELKGWVEPCEFIGIPEGSDDSSAIIKSGEKKNIVFTFEGKYLGGEVNENLSFPEDMVYLMDFYSESKEEMKEEMKNYLESKNTEALEDYLYNKVKPIIEGWDEEGIYAVSLFVYTNEGNVYKGISNFPEFSVGYNTESFADGAGRYSEDRWNFAYWEQNNVPVIDPFEGGEEAEFLLDWYKDQGIENVGREEDEDSMYDENMNYIGRGPVGYFELLCAVSNVGKRLQTEGVIDECLGEDIPVIVHDFEYCWYVTEATENANPDGEADDFLVAVGRDFAE